MNRFGFLIRRLADVPRDDDWLTLGERAFLDGRRSPKRIDDWRLGRWTAKAAVGAFLELHGQVRPESLEVLAAADGAPRARIEGESAPVSLSLSHAGNHALCVVGEANVPLGCDLERIERRSDEFVASYFTPFESTRVALAADDDRALVANLIWSAKESALKALRCGLRADTRSVEVVRWAPAAEGWGSLEVSAASSEAGFAGRWRRLAGLLATVVSPPPARELIDLSLVLREVHRPGRLAGALDQNRLITV